IISISDLQSQRIPCCSRLTLSSDEFREWTHQNETILPDQKYFEQTRLMLIGYLRNETSKKDKMMDGNIYLQDNTGALLCVFLHFKLEWLDHLSLFPSWIYVPQIGEGRTGYLEILEDPIQVQSGSEKNLSTIPVFYPGTAADLLSARPQNKSTAKKTPQLVWHHALQLGHKYVLTDLKISCLKSGGQSVFRTSSSSCLLPYCKEQTKEQCLDVTSQGRPMIAASIMPSIQPKSLLKVQKEEMMLGPLRKSELISYTGTITQVLNAQAGLYKLDNKYILCLAYRQMLNTGCGFRPGACIELRDVHLLEMPLPSIPAAFGACLHTTIVLKSFSAYSILHQPVNCFGNHYLQLLLHYNLSLSFYLYLVNFLEIFEQRFCCFSQHKKLLLCFTHHSQGLIERFIVPILNSLLLPKKQERNFHAEILAEKHSCLLDQICNLNIQELNSRLAQNYCILSAECFNPPLGASSRLYAQFYFEDVKVLHILDKRAKKSPTIYQQTSCDVKDSGSSTTDLTPSVRKTKRKGKEIEESNTREPEHFRNSTEKISCVSRLFLLIQKEGLAWRNYLHNSESKSENWQTMQLCFQATVLWMGKPKLCHSLGESEEQEELK
ncbi:CST complex subunit CTC1, partial [Ophiophagus hannah]